MLTLDPEKRMKMNDIINHKWLQCETDLTTLDNGMNNVDLSFNELTIFKEFKNLVDKVEQM